MRRKRNEEQTITFGEFETEEEAAGAYNIGALIVNGEDAPLNDVPPPTIETFNQVIKGLKSHGWACSQEEMRLIKNMLRIKLGMSFRADV